MRENANVGLFFFCLLDVVDRTIWVDKEAKNVGTEVVVLSNVDIDGVAAVAERVLQYQGPFHSSDVIVFEEVFRGERASLADGEGRFLR